MRKQSLNFDNLGETLAAAPNAIQLGTQQFETPEDVAEALALPLPLCRVSVLDLQCGHGALLRGVKNAGTRRVYGIDIDPTAKTNCGTMERRSEVIHGDLTKIFQLLDAVDARFDLIVANPPFSLRWNIDVSAMGLPPDCDSTLATFRMMHRLLTMVGEGMMICNAATCTRLLEKEALWSRTWLKVVLPNFFPGTAQDMKIAVIYFAKDHKPDPGETGPFEINLPDALPDTIRNGLASVARARARFRNGISIKEEWRAHDSTQHFMAVKEEWQRQTDAVAAERDGWNIRLRADGTLNVYLTPFQSLKGDVPVPLVKALQGLHKKHPMELVVQRGSRKALVLAVNGGIWRVHPAVQAAVGTAVAEYNAVRAPFVRLNPVQRLGYLDEEDRITCVNSRIGGFTPGKSYPLEPETIAGVKTERRKRAHKPEEEVQVTGQELLIRIQDDDKQWHAFTKFQIDDRPGVDYRRTLSDLVEAFDIPEVPDVADCRPDVYMENLAKLRALES